MVRSINSAPGNASPSIFGSTLLYVTARITPQGRRPCGHVTLVFSISCVFSLCLLNFEGRGTLDLGEIYQFGPWKRFAFDFRQHTFAHPRWNHTPGAPALRTCVFALFPLFRRPPFATSSTTLAPGAPCKRCALNFRHFTFAVAPSPKHLRQQNHCGAGRRG